MVVCQWIPSHIGLIEYEKVDLTPRNKAEKGGKQMERWSSLAYIKKNLAKVHITQITKWHKKKIQEREVSCQGFYIPWS